MSVFSAYPGRAGFLDGIGLHLRLVLAGAVTTFLAVALVCGFLVYRQANVLHDEIVRSSIELRVALVERGQLLADSMANSMENAIAGYNFTFVSESLNSVADSNDDLQYGYVTNGGGTMIVHTDAERVGDTIERDFELKKTEFLEAPGAAGVVEIRHPVVVGGERWGTLVLAFGLEPIYKRAQAATERGRDIMLAATRVAAGFAGVVTLFGIIFSVVLSRRLLQPIRRLADDAAAISAGNLSREISVLNSADEIGFLGQQFELMRRAIKNYIGELVVARDKAEAATHQEKRLRGQIEEHTRLLELKVTERTRELQEINKQLTANDRLKTEFLSNVSHELRSPLAAISSAAKIIQRYGDSENKRTGKRFSTVITDESERLGRLINDLLDLAKIEAGRVSWNIRSLGDPVDLLNQVFTTFRPLASESGIDLRLECPPSLPHVMGDRDRLIQVLTNLLSNAMKFTGGGGRVVISGKATKRNGVECIQVSVQDTGPGIPDEEIDKIFDRFHQVRVRKHDINKPEGTGLGLAICREVIQHHGGDIWPERPPEGGTRMVFCLPIDFAARDDHAGNGNGRPSA